MTDHLTIGILALQGDFAEHRQALERAGAAVREVRLPADLEGLHGLVIPGGESTTISRLMLAYDLMDPVRALARSGRPVWGTCAGAIMLAARVPDLDRPTLGLLDVGIRRNAFGRQVESFEVDLPVPALGEPPFHAVFIRAPLIQDVGPDVDVLARLDGGAVVAVRQEHLLATAFHPELTDDLRFHRYFVGMAEARARAEAGPGPK
ncbi:MAG TPA: pyridoxal 5'-phosphate synthase glutaminase subunit PdxT [Dehalococcoidia bacterium]